MPTNGPGAGRVVVSASVPVGTAQILDAKADELAMTRSKYLSTLLQEWAALGCPPLTELERRLATAKKRSGT